MGLVACTNQTNGIGCFLALIVSFSYWTMAATIEVIKHQQPPTIFPQKPIQEPHSHAFSILLNFLIYIILSCGPTYLNQNLYGFVKPTSTLL